MLSKLWILLDYIDYLSIVNVSSVSIGYRRFFNHPDTLYKLCQKHNLNEANSFIDFIKMSDQQDPEVQYLMKTVIMNKVPIFGLDIPVRYLWQALRCAARHSSRKSMKYLHNVLSDMGTIQYSKLLSDSARSGKVRTVRLIEKWCKDINCEKAMTYAASCGHRKIVAHFLKHYDDCDHSFSLDKGRVLIYAAKYNNIHVVRNLLTKVNNKKYLQNAAIKAVHRSNLGVLEIFKNYLDLESCILCVQAAANSNCKNTLEVLLSWFPRNYAWDHHLEIDNLIKYCIRHNDLSLLRSLYIHMNMTYYLVYCLYYGTIETFTYLLSLDNTEVDYHYLTKELLKTGNSEYVSIVERFPETIYDYC